MSIRPVGKLLVVADPPQEDHGLVLPDGAKGPEVGLVVRVGDDVDDFRPGDKVFYRGAAIEIFTQILAGGMPKRVTTKLVSVEQIVAVEDEDRTSEGGLV